MTHNPVGNGVSFTTGPTSARSSIIVKKSDSLRVVSVTADAHVAIGTNPVAAITDYYIPAGGTATLSLGMVKSQKVVGVTTGTSTIIDFPEGTGSAFNVGDVVQLTGITPAGINTTYTVVTNVNDSAGYGGYFNTRLTIDHDTSSGLDAPTDSDGELREVFKVAAVTTVGNGILHAQQVQVTGDA